MKLIIHLICQCLISILIVIFFYNYFKGWVMAAAPKIAFFLKITCHHPLEIAKGVVELCTIVGFHLIFIFLCIYLFNIRVSFLPFSCDKTSLSIFCGILLGIGEMGLASMLSRSVIEIVRCIRPAWGPSEVKDWLVMVRSGWLRHYLYTIEILPLPLSLLIVFGQVACEEIVFRGIFIHYFSWAGKLTAVALATLLFMFMQIFYMPGWLSRVFPLIGAMVIGFIHGMLYLKVPDLTLFIIAHFVFFIVAVL